MLKEDRLLQDVVTNHAIATVTAIELTGLRYKDWITCLDFFSYYSIVPRYLMLYYDNHREMITNLNQDLMLTLQDYATLHRTA